MLDCREIEIDHFGASNFEVGDADQIVSGIGERAFSDIKRNDRFILSATEIDRFDRDISRNAVGDRQNRIDEFMFGKRCSWPSFGFDDEQYLLTTPTLGEQRIDFYLSSAVRDA